jgi:hypothetical protein
LKTKKLISIFAHHRRIPKKGTRNIILIFLLGAFFLVTLVSATNFQELALQVDELNRKVLIS